jgi:hypothetical protein
MLSMLLQVWVRGRRKNTRALARLASPGSGFGRRARDVRVNGPPKSGSNSCGKSAFFCRFVFCNSCKERLSFADLFSVTADKEPIVPYDRLSGFKLKSRLFPMIGSPVSGGFYMIGSPVSGEGRATCA